MEEIRAAGLTLPSLNQVSFHLYHSRAERALLQYCTSHGILFNSWTPLARPDSWVMQPPCAPSPDRDPGAAALAAAKYNATGAALQLAWAMQEGVAVTPRSQNARHMVENLGAAGLVGRIAQEDAAALWAWPLQSQCSTPACTNPVFEGCANNAK